MMSIFTTDIWKVNPTASKHGSSSFKAEAATDIPATDEGDDLLVHLEDIKPTQIDMQSMLESAIHIFE